MTAVVLSTALESGHILYVCLPTHSYVRGCITVKVFLKKSQKLYTARRLWSYLYIWSAPCSLSCWGTNGLREWSYPVYMSTHSLLCAWVYICKSFWKNHKNCTQPDSCGLIYTYGLPHVCSLAGVQTALEDGLIMYVCLPTHSYVCVGVYL